MQYGDLSNKLGSAIVINADLIFNLKKKWLGLRYELSFMLSSRVLLDEWFSDGDLSIIIACGPKFKGMRKEVINMLDTFMVPYTNVYTFDTAGELQALVDLSHVIGYFYFEDTVVNERMTLGKHYQILNLAEINHLLDGGVRNGR